MPCFLLPGTRHSVMPRRDISPLPSPAQDNSIVGRSIRGGGDWSEDNIGNQVTPNIYRVLSTQAGDNITSSPFLPRIAAERSNSSQMLPWHYWLPLGGYVVVCNASIYYWARGGYCIISQLNTNDNSLLLIYLITQCNALILMQRYNGTAWSFKRL